MAARRVASSATKTFSVRKEKRQSPYERLKQAILNGELSPSQPLIETQLAEWCQVSRTPIREALTRLEQDGLVIRSDRGLVVRERSPEEILDIYETRIVLESAAARAAATRRSRIDILTLRQILSEADDVPPGDSDAMFRHNREIHGAIWRASHNESLIDLLTRLDHHLARYPATTLGAPGRWEEACGEHRAIIDAIENQQPDVAAELTTEHFMKARDLRLKLWAQSLRTTGSTSSSA